MRTVPLKIACLHTAESNIPVYEDARRQLGLPEAILRHVVRADLLFSAERAGGLTPGIEAETADILLELAHDADAVILNCSTLGPATRLAVPKTGLPVIRADGALAKRAVKDSGKVVVLCTTTTTIEPTTRLFEEEASLSNASIEVRLIGGAWELFRAGDHTQYLAVIAKAAEAAYDSGATTVAFAQASMTGAASLLHKRYARPVSGPAAALEATMRAIAGK